MAAQDAVFPVLDQRVEDAVATQELARVLLHPQPGAHLEGQRQEHFAAGAGRLPVQMVPEVAVSQVLAALRFELVGVVGVRADEDLVQRMQFRQLRHRGAAVRVREPDAIAHAEAGMTVQRQAEGATVQLARHRRAQGAALRFHGGAGAATVPGQVGAEALAAHEERHPACSLERRIAHEVDAGRIGARVAGHAARIHQRHEH